MHLISTIYYFFQLPKINSIKSTLQAANLLVNIMQQHKYYGERTFCVAFINKRPFLPHACSQSEAIQFTFNLRSRSFDPLLISGKVELKAHSMREDFGSMAFQNKEINNLNQDNPRLETVGADQIIQSNTLLNNSKITNSDR